MLRHPPHKEHRSLLLSALKAVIIGGIILSALALGAFGWQVISKSLGQ